MSQVALHLQMGALPLAIGGVVLIRKSAVYRKLLNVLCFYGTLAILPFFFLFTFSTA